MSMMEDLISVTEQAVQNRIADADSALGVETLDIIKTALEIAYAEGRQSVKESEERKYNIYLEMREKHG